MLDQDLAEIELMEEYGMPVANIYRERAVQYVRQHPNTNTSAHIEQSIRAASYAGKFGESERSDQILENAAEVAEKARRREKLLDWQKRMGENDGR